jgi:hypothetical protein
MEVVNKFSASFAGKRLTEAWKILTLHWVSESSGVQQWLMQAVRITHKIAMTIAVAGI